MSLASNLEIPLPHLMHDLQVQLERNSVLFYVLSTHLGMVEAHI